jgi:hypothetical protein
MAIALSAAARDFAAAGHSIISARLFDLKRGLRILMRSARSAVTQAGAGFG